MTSLFPETKTGLRLSIASAAVTGALAMVLLAGLAGTGGGCQPGDRQG